MREREVETYGTQQFRGKLRAEVRKLKWLDRRGAPDRFVASPLIPGAVWLIEYKSTEGKLRPEQKREIARLRAAGVTVLVLSSKADVDHAIHWALHGRHLMGAPTIEQVCRLYDKLGADAETDKLVDELV